MSRWVCDQLEHYQNVAESGFGVPHRYYPVLDIVTDEARRFFWVDIVPARSDAFARVHASLTNDVLRIRATDARSVSVSLDLVARGTVFSRFDVVTSVPLTLRVLKGTTPVSELDLETSRKGELPEAARR